MNNSKSLQEMINSLKPEEYADFVDCMKENFSLNIPEYPQRYKMFKSILMDPENKAYFNTLTLGSQIAMILFVCLHERTLQLQEEINKALKRFDD